MKKEKQIRIGRLAEARQQIAVRKAKVAQAIMAFHAAYNAAREFDESYFVKYNSSGFPQDMLEARSQSEYLWQKSVWASETLDVAKEDLQEAEKLLSEIQELMRPGYATVTATSKNRVPYSAPEMEDRWNLLQLEMESLDDNRYKCLGCRREKAHLNANSKPSKARK